MNLLALKNIAKSFGYYISKNSPAILTYISVGSLVGTAILSGVATPKALAIIDEEKKYRKDNSIKDITPLDVAKLTWTLYLPVVSIGTLGIASIIGAHSIHKNRYAALGAVYSLTGTAFKEYKEKVISTIGKGKEQKVCDEITQDRVNANPVHTNDILDTGYGSTLCYDNLIGRYFYSNIEQIRKAINDINHQLLRTGEFTSLNDVYYVLGLPNVDVGNNLGWEVDDGLIEVIFTSTISHTNKPCIVVNFIVQPRFI